MANPEDTGGPDPANLPSIGGEAVAVDNAFLGWETGQYEMSNLLEEDSETGDTHHNEVYFATDDGNQYAIFPRDAVEDELVHGGVLDLTGTVSPPEAATHFLGSRYVLVDLSVSRARGSLHYTPLPDDELGQTVLNQNEPFTLVDRHNPHRITGPITAVDSNDLLDEFDLAELPASSARSSFWDGMPAEQDTHSPHDQEPGPQSPDHRSWRAIVGLGGLDEMSALNLEHNPDWPPTAANQLRQVAETYFQLLGSRYAPAGTPAEGTTVDLGPLGESRLGAGYEKLNDNIGYLNWGDDLALLTRSRAWIPANNPPPLEANMIGIQIGTNRPLSFTMTIPTTSEPMHGQEVSEAQTRPPSFTVGRLSEGSVSPDDVSRAIEELRLLRPELAGLLDPVHEVLRHAAECPQDADGAYIMTDEQMDIIRTEFLPATLDPSRMPKPTEDARWNHPHAG